jgi:hypothetical protein
MAKDTADQLIHDVFEAVRNGKAAAPSTFTRAARYVDRNKRKAAVMVAAGVATALVAAATGGVALLAVAAYAGAKGGTFLAKRSWRAAKSARYMRPVKAVLQDIQNKNDESLAVERVNGDLVARKGLGPLLNNIRNEIQHSNMTAVMNDFQEFENARQEFDRVWNVTKGAKAIHSCSEGVRLIELLAKMAKHYHRLADDFELLCELATFMMLQKTAMDDEFRRTIDPVMEHLSGCYGRGTGEGTAKFENKLLDLLNEAANSKQVLRHWNEFGGKDHRNWVGSVMGVEGKGDILVKYLEKSQSSASGPYSASSRDRNSGILSTTVGVGTTGATTGVKALSNQLSIYRFDPSAFGPGAAVGAGEALVGAVAEYANAHWNRYMMRTGKTLSFKGWRELSTAELVALYRTEAKKEIEAMVDKFSHLMTAHEEYMRYAGQISTYSKGFSTLLLPATALMRRQKLYWQIFHAESGLFATFAQFYERLAFPAVLNQANYLRDSDDPNTIHSQVEGMVRAWLSGHGDYEPCDPAGGAAPCYMTAQQFATRLGFAVAPLTQEDPIRPVGAKTVTYKPS